VSGWRQGEEGASQISSACSYPTAASAFSLSSLTSLDPSLSFAKTTYVIDFVDFFAGEQEPQCHEEFSASTDGFLHLNLQRTMRVGA
jgi:hypothetical protein